LSCEGALSIGSGYILLLSLREDHQEKKILVLEMGLMHCFAVIKEIATGGGTSGILYNLFPKVTITAQH
jgi:hypothetical protein